MIFWATFKTPDAATHESFLEQAEKFVMADHPEAVMDHNGVDHIDPERDDLVDRYNELAHDMVAFAKRWVGHGETITIEFNTDEGTARPVVRKR
jgi:hypothetical protein